MFYWNIAINNIDIQVVNNWKATILYDIKFVSIWYMILSVVWLISNLLK